MNWTEAVDQWVKSLYHDNVVTCLSPYLKFDTTTGEYRHSGQWQVSVRFLDPDQTLPL